eukprot:NODE_431_length_2259_cov_132.100905_g397_i0.p1 GENE.NODE_431_length_2259_cov_132.100905_g397_i0~~NODE_431_length_2259_cov_132.100905_g397_i0.p1  ORF type:complete len:702 (+),score=119.79 NODE_431_length_2259_cov_132.100905_g397_i0:52-2157(+)
MMFLLLCLVSVSTAVPIIWDQLDGRFPDQCVNKFDLGAEANLRDCPANTQAPFAGATYLLPSGGAAVANMRLTGSFIPTTGLLTLSQASAEPSCATVDTALEVTPTTATSSALTFTVPASWQTSAMEFEQTPRKLCFRSNPGSNFYQWTGFYIGVVWSCNTADRLCSGRDWSAIQTANSLSDFQTAILAARTTCCVNNPGVQATLPVSQCINPNVESCCGATSFGPAQKCCNQTTEQVAWVDGTCWCRGGSPSDCPDGLSCCTHTKYPELAGVSKGECYDPKFERCCDTGNKYDPGSSQCCLVNGLQTVNTPCPCSQDSDCAGGQAGLRLTDQACCRQTAPVPNELSAESSINRCTKYINYPSGTGSYADQQCLGWCFDTRYQICCNGVQCRRQFEKCCNATCCNMFNGTCSTSILRRSPSRHNWQDFGVAYEVCTVVEQLNPVNSFWVFILPTALLLATLGGLALALVFASKVEHRARRSLEKMQLAAALVAILFAIPTYFSPAYKYGVVILVVSLFAIMAAAARKVRVYALCLVLHVILFLYLWDPFHGNDYLTFASDRTERGQPDPRTAGLLHAVSRSEDSSIGNGHQMEMASLTAFQQEVSYLEDTCYKFYDYFRIDPILRDTVRFDDPNIHFFGFCSRGWIIAILVCQGIVMIAVFAQTILTLLALFIRGGLLKHDYFSSGVRDFDEVSSRSSRSS